MPPNAAACCAPHSLRWGPPCAEGAVPPPPHARSPQRSATRSGRARPCSGGHPRPQRVPVPRPRSRRSARRPLAAPPPSSSPRHRRPPRSSRQPGAAQEGQSG
eukprot:scaffold396_cov339-Prasinococcus_capsulatus_cf.AAC.11